MRSILLLSSVAVAAVLAACSVDTLNTGTAHRTSTTDGTGDGAGSGSGSGGGASTGTTGNGATGGSGSGSGSGSGTTSGSGSGATTGGPTITADETWMDGKQITGPVTVAAGVTVTVAAGATVTVTTNATITVAGTLKATANATHAKITGAAWGGLVVAVGGTLTADSLDIEHAATALDVKGTGTWDNGVITAATVPFFVEKGGSLSTAHSQVVGTLGMTSLNGTFTASHLDYDSNGNEGVSMGDASAVVSIEDSVFHGTSTVGGDMIRASAAKSIHVAYSEIKGCHCAFHFDGVTSFDVSYMNVHDDSYGFMMYGSDATGTRTVKSSNFATLAAAGIDESGTNGAITVDGCYFDTSAKLNVRDQQVTVSNQATAAVTGVGPRP